MGVDASGGGAGAGSAQPGAAGASTAASNPTPTDILRGGDVCIDDSNAHDEPELPLHSTGARITYQVVNSDGWRVDGSLHSYKIYEKIIAQRVEGPNPPPDWNRSNHDPVDLGNTGEFVDYITFPTGVDRPYTYNSTTIQQFYVSVDGAPPVPIGPQMRQEIDVVNGTATQVHVVEVHP